MATANKTAYLWTADDAENSRLDLQHHMLSDVAWHGKPYLGPVEEVLSSDGTAVLDLGTGSGIWAIDMALRFPKARVLGVDLCPKLRPTPPNCSLQTYDINVGLGQWYGAFDVVHTRLVSSGIRDYPNMITEMGKVLRPRGLLELGEWDFRVYDSEHQPRPIHPEGHPDHSYITQWLWTLREAGAARGGHMDAANHLQEWVQGSGLFDQIEAQDTWIPLSAPAGDTPDERHRMQAIHEKMKEDVRFFVRAARPALLRQVDPDALSKIEDGMMNEVDNSAVTMYVRLQVVWGRKKM